MKVSPKKQQKILYINFIIFYDQTMAMGTIKERCRCFTSKVIFTYLKALLFSQPDEVH
jgi:hypothetical protein